MLEKEGLVALKRNFIDKELLLRIFSSIILILLVISFNYLGNYYFFFLTCLIFYFLLKEYYRLFRLRLFNINFLVNFVIVFFSFLFAYYEFYILIIISIFLGILLGYILEKKKWKVIIFGYLYLTVPLLTLLYLNQNALNGKIIIIWTFVIVWSSDTSAYFFGKIIRGPKLLPKISPNKTWSGLISSVLFSMIISGIFSYYFNLTGFLYGLFIGLITSIFCNIGDLFESWLKRINFKKDSSNLIPGHGGVLDRLDGFLFAILIITFIT